MKKFLVFLVALFVVSTAYAAHDVREVLEEITLNETTTGTVTEAIDIRDADKVSFFVKSNSSTDTVTCEVTIEISYDGTTWVRAYLNDFEGGSTLQTSGDFYDDYYFWLNRDYITAPYVRVHATIGNTVGSDGADVTIGAGDSNTISVEIVREK